MNIFNDIIKLTYLNKLSIEIIKFENMYFYGLNNLSHL